MLSVAMAARIFCKTGKEKSLIEGLAESAGPAKQNDADVDDGVFWGGSWKDKKFMRDLEAAVSSWSR